MDDNGTYLGNIYGIYKECITNISIDIYDITINIHKYIHQTHRPNGAAAEGGRPIGAPPKAAPVFLIINIYGYALYIPYIFHIYFLAMFHIFSLVCFLIYGVKRRQVLIAKPRFYFYFFRIYTFYIFINYFMIFY